jgi:hypothetical protein
VEIENRCQIRLGVLSLKGKECLFDESKECDECGECEICDLEENKICDNCCRCLGDADYRAVEITEIILPEEIKLKRKKNSANPLKK